MNPFVLSSLGLLARVLTLLASGYGFAVSTDELTQALAGLATAATLVYQLYRKYKDRQKLVTALAADYPMSEHAVEYLIAAGGGARATTPKSETPK